MTAEFSDRGIILRWKKFGDGDGHAKILTLQHGLVGAIAKGALKSTKRYGGSLDLFHHIHFEIKRRHMEAPYFVNHASLINAFTGIRQVFEKLWMASVMADVVVRTVEEEHHGSEGEYLTVGSAFQWLSRADVSQCHWIGSAFFAHWAYLQGWLPEARAVQDLLMGDDESKKLWDALLAVPLWTALTRKASFLEERPAEAGLWFDRLLSWMQREHGLNLKIAAPSLSALPFGGK